jgi:predicted site-specific integrase-resolvase
MMYHIMKTYSTKQAAKAVGISWITLRRWLSAGKIRPSKSLPYDGRNLWRWTDADVEKLQRYKDANYRKGRGRKRGEKPKV